MFYHQPVTESRIDEVVPLSNPTGTSGLPDFDDDASQRVQARTPAGAQPLTSIGQARNSPAGTTQGLLASPVRPFNEFIE